MQDLLNAFQLKGKPVFCQRFGEGHINETYITTCDTGLSYILQKINTNTFKDPVGLMENVSSVTDFLAKNSDDPRGAMRIVRAKDGKPYHVDGENHYWRVYDFVPSSVCLQMAESTKDFYNTGLAFGRFQKSRNSLTSPTELTMTFDSFPAVSTIANSRNYCFASC